MPQVANTQVFVNASTSDVVATTSVEALAMVRAFCTFSSLSLLSSRWSPAAGLAACRRWWLQLM